jgi:hypothetical protein
MHLRRIRPLRVTSRNLPPFGKKLRKLSMGLGIPASELEIVGGRLWRVDDVTSIVSK